MRRLIRRLTLNIAALMIIAIPALAANGIGSQEAATAQQNGKVGCLAMNTDCHVTMSYPDKLDWLQSEIDKGTAVYSREELNVMRERVKKTIEEFEDSMLGGW